MCGLVEPFPGREQRDMGDAEQKVPGGKRPEDARQPRVCSQDRLLVSHDLPGSANIARIAELVTLVAGWLVLFWLSRGMQNASTLPDGLLGARGSFFLAVLVAW